MSYTSMTGSSVNANVPQVDDNASSEIQSVLVDWPRDGSLEHVTGPNLFRSETYKQLVRAQQEQQHGAFDLILGDGV